MNQNVAFWGPVVDAHIKKKEETLEKLFPGWQYVFVQWRNGLRPATMQVYNRIATLRVSPAEIPREMEPAIRHRYSDRLLEAESDAYLEGVCFLEKRGKILAQPLYKIRQQQRELSARVAESAEV